MQLTKRAATLWFTGLSGAGKTTLADALYAALLTEGLAATVLDGDVVRRGLCKDLGFSPADRSENIRRVAELARMMNEAGLFVIGALISPFAADRMSAKEIIGAQRFLEVHIATSLAVCEQRDPKGLYGKARAGQLAQFTGISSPYEAPDSPALRLDLGILSLQDAVAMCMGAIERHQQDQL